jgi:hypothetical protein
MHTRVGRLGVDISLHTGLRTAVAILQEQGAMSRAFKRMPKPVTWDWARPRILPLLAGPYIDVDGEGPVRAVPTAGLR